MNITANKKSSKADINHLIFFDGVCGLCNKSVDFLMRKDKNHIFLFTPLQGETAKTFQLPADLADLQTVIFYKDGTYFTKSNAVIEISLCLGGIWKLAVVFKIVPKIFRDYLYNFVARNRIKWFGEKETCRMPTQQERGRLLP